MNTDTCSIVVYTQSGAIEFDVKCTTDNFKERLAEALEQGTVLLNLADGGEVIISAINVVAIEIQNNILIDDKTSDIPPIQKI